MGTKEPVESPELVRLDEALGRLGGDLTLFREFACIYLEDSPAMIRDVLSAAESRDSGKLERSAHALKGLASNFGARPFVDLVRQIEQAGKSNELDGLKVDLSRLSQLHKQLCEELARFQ